MSNTNADVQATDQHLSVLFTAHGLRAGLAQILLRDFNARLLYNNEGRCYILPAVLGRYRCAVGTVLVMVSGERQSDLCLLQRMYVSVYFTFFYLDIYIYILI